MQGDQTQGICESQNEKVPVQIRSVATNMQSQIPSTNGGRFSNAEDIMRDCDIESEKLDQSQRGSDGARSRGHSEDDTENNETC